MTQISEDSKPEFIGQIVDVFEDWLAVKEIMLKNPERETAIKEEEMDPEETAIIYGKHYDMIGDTVDWMIREHDLMNRSFSTSKEQRRQINTIMDSFYNMLEDGGQKKSVVNGSKMYLKDKISKIFRNWGLEAEVE